MEHSLHGDLVVATSVHVVFADVGWFDRHQAYLIALGVHAMLLILPEHRPRARYLAPVLALLLTLLAAEKISLLVTTPTSIDNTDSQRYQAARFLERY